MKTVLRFPGSVRLACAAIVLVTLSVGMSGPVSAEEMPMQSAPKPAGVVNDYPTLTRVDYVIACMASNGNTREVARKCSCSIDAIAAEFPHEKYVAVETARIMQELPGERASMMRGINWIKDLLEEFRAIQVAADLRCFQ